MMMTSTMMTSMTQALSLASKQNEEPLFPLQKSKVFQKFTSQVRSPRPPKNEVKTEQTGAKVKQREREREREREGGSALLLLKRIRFVSSRLRRRRVPSVLLKDVFCESLLVFLSDQKQKEKNERERERRGRERERRRREEGARRAALDGERERREKRLREENWWIKIGGFAWFQALQVMGVAVNALTLSV